MEEDTPAAIHPLALKIQKLFNKDLVEEYEFLRAQLEVAVEIRGKRYQFTDQQRGTLVKYGEPVKGHLDELCKLMKPETLLRWHRDQKRKKWDYSGRPRKKVGRPPIGKATERLIVEMADENELWGCRTIAGELKKLGHIVSHTTVFNILKAHGMPLDPNRKALSWKKFIQSHMEVTWACDFFTEEVWSVGGLVTLYALFFIHLKTRRVHFAGVTSHPGADWMKQQARNFLMVVEDSGLRCRYLIHDQDSTFLLFDPVIKSDDINVVRTPKGSPWCNGFAERFVREARGTLNNLILVGENQLHVTMKKIERHHNFRRPHQSIGNRVPLDFEYPAESALPEDVRCDSGLGGLLNHYYVEKAA